MSRLNLSPVMLNSFQHPFCLPEPTSLDEKWTLKQVGVYASSGKMEKRTVSKSSTTTNADRLHIPHAGELLMSEFMEPLGLDCDALADAIAVDPARLEALITGHERIDGELDLRLARYFRMSEGFFLGLQDDYELRVAKRALNGDLEKIVPRAA